MLKKLKNNKLFYVVSELVKRYFSHGISRAGAELAYFFLFSILAFMIFITSLVGILDLDIAEIASSVEYVVPSDVVALLDEYTTYLTSIVTDSLMYTGVLLTFYFITRSVNALIYAINMAYGVKEKRNFLLQTLLSGAFTALLIISMIAVLMLLIAGKSFILYISEFLGFEVLYLNIWNILRFVIAACFISATLLYLYVLIPKKRIKLKQAMPGTLLAMVAWLTVTIVFSFYVENMGRFSFLYGSIGAIIVLMLWLYLTGIILVIGAELNNILETRDN